MRKLFIAGLATLLPLALTIILIVWVITFFTTPYVNTVVAILKKLGLFKGGLGFIPQGMLLAATSQLLILAIFVLLTMGLGVIARWIAVNYLVNIGESFVARIPLIRKIYQTNREITDSILNLKPDTFTQVVLAPFLGTKCLGLVTKNFDKNRFSPEHEFLAVFIPETPNPTVGFILHYRKEDLIFVDMTVEEGLKCIVSCGAAFPDSKEKAPGVK